MAGLGMGSGKLTSASEVVDEPAVAEGTVGYVGDVEVAGGGDEAVGFVEGFEGGVFGLDGVDFGDWEVCVC
jgi:hypothetical protein